MTNEEISTDIVESVKTYKGDFKREAKYLQKDLERKITNALSEKDKRIESLEAELKSTHVSMIDKTAHYQKKISELEAKVSDLQAICKGIELSSDILHKEKEELSSHLRACLEALQFCLGKEVFSQGAVSADKETEAYTKAKSALTFSPKMLERTGGDEMNWVNWAIIIVGIATNLLGTAVIMGAMWGEINPKDYVKKSSVVECFKEVNWDKEAFKVNGEFLKSSKNGETYFYKTKSIDEAISKLNKELKP